MGVVLSDPVTPMSLISEGASKAISFMTSAFQAMTGNVYLAVFLGVTMIGSGICLFRTLFLLWRFFYGFFYC